MLAANQPVGSLDEGSMRSWAAALFALCLASGPGHAAADGSAHFDDLLALWREGRYFPLRYSKAAVDEVTTDVLTLMPP
jgi:hypothetical protein